MKYIIMCGGKYADWKIPRQFTLINDEPIVARTIRLLKEVGISDIYISTNDKRFEVFGVPLLYHKNDFQGYVKRGTGGCWVDGFYPMTEPACYLFGDVVFSPYAVGIIKETHTDGIQFFASAPPFSPDYIKSYAEPFAFKVVDQLKFKKAIEFVRENENRFRRRPIAWELWQVIKGTKLNSIDYTNYTVINDYTCDIDSPDDVRKFKCLNI